MAENITVDPKDAEDNKVMAVLAYLGILVLVPIFAAKESPFARYHANQGLILLIAGIAIYMITYIATFVIIAISLSLAWIISIFNAVVGLGMLAFIIIGIINAIKGEAKELPLIGKYTILK